MLSPNTVGNGPAFSAYKSANQTLSHNVLTKVTFDTEAYDTNNNFDATTNSRFQPTVAGYYQVTSIVDFNGTFNRSYILDTQVFKNGAAVKYSVVSPILGNGAEYSVVNNPPPIYMNGTTDYLELYAYSYDYSAGSTVYLSSTSAFTSFGAYLVRAA